MGRGNQYIQLVKVVYCTLLTICKKVPSFQHRICGMNRQPQRLDVSVLPLSHHGPQSDCHRFIPKETLILKCIYFYVSEAADFFSCKYPTFLYTSLFVFFICSSKIFPVNIFGVLQTFYTKRLAKVKKEWV